MPWGWSRSQKGDDLVRLLSSSRLFLKLVVELGFVMEDLLGVGLGVLGCWFSSLLYLSVICILIMQCMEILEISLFLQNPPKIIMIIKIAHMLNAFIDC